jgi:hypothetical protein
MSGENIIQSACMDSLAVYFRENGMQYRQLWTYANQQGDGANKFCGDLIGMIDNATMFALEMKALNHVNGELAAFDEDQFKEALAMEKTGIPIFYCYDTCAPLAYYADPRPHDWPSQTLNGLNLSRPKQLDCKKPKRKSHQSLLQWLNHQSGMTATSPLMKFAEMVGQVLPQQMRNGLVTVFYSQKHREALALNQDSMQVFYDYLSKHPGIPGSEVDRRINLLLNGIQAGQSKATTQKKSNPTRKKPII